MKLRKLDVRGVAHEFLIIAVLVIFSIVGIGYVVAGNANPSDGKASSAKPVPIPFTSGEAKGTVISCGIDPLPATIGHMQRLRPSVTIINDGNRTYTGSIQAKLSLFDIKDQYIREIKPKAKLITIKAGKTRTYTLPSYQVPYAKNGGLARGHYSLSVEGLGLCTNDVGWFTFPKNPKQKTDIKPMPPRDQPITTDG